MIRRPLTEIELKLDDLQEYEALRREQTSSSAVAADSSPEMHTPKPWDRLGPKPTDEIHNRIGYAPKKKPTMVANSNSV